MSDSRETQLWRLVAPLPASRNLILGYTGSGKSTLEAALIEQYHTMHPAHTNWIIDLKDRFFPTQARRDGSLFPGGWGASIYKKRLGTAIRAQLVSDVNAPRLGGNGVYVIKSRAAAWALIERLFAKADYAKKNMLWFDELLPFCSRQGVLDPPVQRVLQLGRERGIGAVAISQRAIWLDGRIASQSGRWYIGALETRDDLERIADLKGIPGIDTKRERMEFWTVDDYQFRVYDRQHGINLTMKIDLGGIAA